MNKINKELIYNEYLEIQKSYVKQYGIKTITFIENGAFYQLYSNEEEYCECFDDVIKLLGILKTKHHKEKPFDKLSNPHSAGFNIKCNYEHRITVLLDNDYTIIEVTQTGTTTKNRKNRKVTNIITNGTYINNDNISNNLISMYISYDNNKNIAIGITIIDISIGKTTIYEDIFTAFDEVQGFNKIASLLSSYDYKELIINTKSCKYTEEDIIGIFKLSNTTYKININNMNNIIYQQCYQEKILNYINCVKNINMSIIEYFDLENMEYGLISYIYILNYIYQLNEDNLKLLSKPNIIKNNENVILLNNVLGDLNIVRNNNDKQYKNLKNKKTKSIFDLTNYTNTKMGYRRYLYEITHPITNCDKLNDIYNDIDKLIKNKYVDIDFLLLKINDLDKYKIRISKNKLYLYELNKLFYNLKNVLELYKIVDNNYITISQLNTHKIDLFLTYLSDNVYIDTCIKYNTSDTCDSEQIIKDDTSKLICKDINDIKLYFYKLQESFNDIINSSKKDSNKDLIDDDENIIDEYDDRNKKFMCKLKQNSTNGLYIDVSNMRYKILEESNKINMNDYFIKKKKNTTSIICKQKSEKIVKYKDKLSKLHIELYKKLMNECSNYIDIINEISIFISGLDCLLSRAKCALKHDFIKPIISNKYNNSSYLNVKQLRHPIIEILIKDKYIPNDILLTDDHNGMIIMGPNASGKSSILKMIGILVFLLQTGNYVPCNSIEYYPFNTIITKLDLTDNIFNGQSSFDIEVLNMRSIVGISCKNSIIITDELGNTTENYSGVSIVASIIEYIAKQNIKFCFATHYHELCDIIKPLENVLIYNMDTIVKNKQTVYNRILQKGPSSTLYGIEVCETKGFDTNIIKRAYEIRNLLIGKNTDIKLSKYNNEVLVDECVLCKSTKDLHTHHIRHQSKFNSKNISKHNKNNLVILCKQCHNDLHKN